MSPDQTTDQPDSVSEIARRWATNASTDADPRTDGSGVTHDADEQTEPNAAPLTELTGFQLTLLYGIADCGETHGQGARGAVQQFYDTDLDAGRLYPNLDTLAHKGYVEKGSVDKRTNSYTLTDAGREALRADCDWRHMALGDGDE